MAINFHPADALIHRLLQQQGSSLSHKSSPQQQEDRVHQKKLRFPSKQETQLSANLQPNLNQICYNCMVLVVANSKQEKCRLLIIEDDAALAALLEEYLSKSNYNVQVINDGSSAITLLATQHFDMVLSDIMLPGVDGMTILKKVGGDFTRTIVVLMTGYSGIDDALSAVKQGAYDFVSKPFQLPEIKIRLDNAASYQKLLRQMQGEDNSYYTAEQTAVKIYSTLQASSR